MSTPGKRLLKQVGEMGDTIVLTTSLDQAQEIVAAAAARKDDYSVLADGTIGIAFMTPDDAVVTIVRDDLGVRVQVDRLKEHHGLVMVGSKWAKLRKYIAEAAATAHVPTAPGPVLTYTRGPEAEDTRADWTLNT